MTEFFLPEAVPGLGMCGALPTHFAATLAYGGFKNISRILERVARELRVLSDYRY